LSKPATIERIPMPTDVTLSDRRINADWLAFARNVVMTILQQIVHQNEDTSAQDEQLFETFSVPHLKVNFRPGASISHQGNVIAFGDNSQLSLNNVVFKDRKNWSGQLKSSLQLTGNSCYKNKELEILPQTATAIEAQLSVNCQNDIITAQAADDKSGAKIFLGTVAIEEHNAKQRLTLKDTKLTLNKLMLSHNFKDNDNEFDSSGSISSNGSIKLLSGTTAITSKIGNASVFPFELQEHAGSSKDSCKLISSTSLQLLDATITKKIAEGELELAVEGIKLDPFSVETGAVSTIKLNGAELRPKAFRIKTPKSELQFDLSKSQIRSLSPISLNQNKDGAINISPLNLEFSGGHISVMKNQEKLIDIDKLAGKIGASFDASKSTIDLDLNGKTGTPTLGFGSVALQLHKMRITCDRSGQKIALDDCVIELNKEQLASFVKKLIPTQLNFSLNETMQFDVPGRWRNPCIKEIALSNLKLEKLAFGENSVEAGLKTDAQLKGEVERCRLSAKVIDPPGLLKLPHPKITANFEPRNWSAKASDIASMVNGHFSFRPGKSLHDSSVTVTLDSNVTMPEKIDLDWSSVADDAFSKVEKTLSKGLISIVHKIYKNGIPIHKEETIPLFSDNKKTFSLLGSSPDKRLKQVMVSKFSCVPRSDNLDLVIQGNIGI
ncbi:MAG: hypothetical protein K2X81_10685, partial [Candidatus Obscuribacterales bacterium]|nr:hypothetical protein [Candidatus Obscuribacterales bacterium]